MGDLSKGSLHSTFLVGLYLVFVLFNTLLIMNLLIAMMADTFAKDSDREGFTMVRLYMRLYMR